MTRVLPVVLALLLTHGTPLLAQHPAGDSIRTLRSMTPVSPLSGRFRLSSVFDSNLDRDEESLDVYGVVAGAGAMFQHRGDDADVTLEYETAIHRYTRSEKWDRLSHRLRALYEREVDSRWSVGAESEITIKGSSEDRTVGDQYVMEPRIEYEIDRNSHARLYGALRLRRYAQEPEQNAVNRYLGAEFSQKLDDDREWEVGLRYEVNDADSARRYYRRWTWHTKFSTAVSHRDELELELKLRTRVFPERFIEVEDEDVPRQDQRWIPSVAWTRALGSRLGLEVQYEYETRSSNDPEQAFRGHQLRMSLFVQGW